MSPGVSPMRPLWHAEGPYTFPSVTILDDARSGMNPDIRPQDDLFGHVNGTWLETTEIPQDRSSWGPFVELAEGVEANVREIIEACARGEGDSDEERKIGDVFTSFMDEERIESLGAEPLTPLFEEIAAISDKDQLAAFIGGDQGRGRGGPLLVFLYTPYPTPLLPP